MAQDGMEMARDGAGWDADRVGVGIEMGWDVRRRRMGWGLLYDVGMD
jgi:hypothetical protein